MSRIYIVCEGKTESMFVSKLVKPYLQNNGICVTPLLLNSSPNGRSGGVSSYAQIKREIKRVCGEHPNELVTTLIDYSPVLELNLDYDGKGTVLDTVRSKESAIEKDLDMSNLIMNFELHEFEAYLYCNPDAYEEYGKNAPKHIREIVRKSGGPESINTDVNKLPSKRMNDIIEGYTESKLFYANILLDRITLEQMCQQCPHLNEWIQKIVRWCKSRQEIV